ncbi:MAG: molybdate ABC transporter permease subunit [Anaerolineaceae bacterium]
MNFGAVDWNTFRVSAQIAILATFMCVLVGTPLAWAIARSRLAIASLLSSLALLPLVLPPTAIGYYVLYGLGRQSAFGRFLIDDLGIRLVFTWQGAAISASIVALPLFVRTAQAGFEQIENELLDVAGTMANKQRVFWRIAIPLAWPSLVAAGLIAFARSIGEFGATIIVAANIPGETQTVPGAIYDATQAGNESLANTLALLTVVLGVALLSALAFVLYRPVQGK